MLTFSRTTQAYDPATDTMVPTVTTITGEAMVLPGDPEQYRALGLVLETTPMVGFTPTGYPLKAYTPEFVLPGDTCLINEVTMTVKRILKIVALDGYVVYARIAVGV